MNPELLWRPEHRESKARAAKFHKHRLYMELKQIKSEWNMVEVMRTPLWTHKCRCGNHNTKETNIVGNDIIHNMAESRIHGHSIYILSDAGQSMKSKPRVCTIGHACGKQGEDELANPHGNHPNADQDKTLRWKCAKHAYTPMKGNAVSVIGQCKRTQDPGLGQGTMGHHRSMSGKQWNYMALHIYGKKCPSENTQVEVGETWCT